MAEYNVKLESMTRLASLPLVNSVCDFTSKQYNHAKEYSGLGYMLNKTEVLAKKTAETALPVVNKLEKPISTLDQLATMGLDLLEKAVPAIKKDPAEVSDALKDIYCKTAQSALVTKTYEQMKSLATGKVKNIFEDVPPESWESVNQQAHSSLDFAERMIDLLLVPVEKEEELEKADGTLSSRIANLFNLVILRLKSSNMETILKLSFYYENEEIIAKFVAVFVWLYLLSRSTIMSLSSTCRPYKESYSLCQFNIAM